MFVEDFNWLWSYLTRGLIWHLSQSFIMYLIRLWIHARICSCNQQVLNNKGKVSCSMKQRGPLMGLEQKTSTLRVRRATHCATPPRNTSITSLWKSADLLEETYWSDKCPIKIIKSVLQLSYFYYTLYEAGWVLIKLVLQYDATFRWITCILYIYIYEIPKRNNTFLHLNGYLLSK